MTNLLTKLKEIFGKIEDVEFAYLFGSSARGDEFPLSDIDIAVYMRSQNVRLDDELRLHSILSRGLKSNKVDLVILNRARNIILLEEIIRHGRVVCDNNSSLRESFELNVLHDAIDFKRQRKVFAGV